MEIVNESDIKSRNDKRYNDKSMIKRFNESVDKNGPNGCHIWKGNVLSSSGYGRMGVNGKYIRAHRLSYMLYKGDISEGKIIMHLCNNKLCVNPEHLKEGTCAENTQQMIDEGRQVNGNAILTKDDAYKIRELYNTGQYSYEMLVEMFNTTKPNIAFIIRNEIWKDNDYKRIFDTKIGRNRKLIYTREQVDKIKEEYSNGSHQRDLAIKYKLSKGTIYNILHDKIKGSL